MCMLLCLCSNRMKTTHCSIFEKRVTQTGGMVFLYTNTLKQRDKHYLDGRAWGGGGGGSRAEAQGAGAPREGRARQLRRARLTILHHPRLPRPECRTK